MWIISDVLISEPHHVFGTSNVFNWVFPPRDLRFDPSGWWL